MGINAGPCCRMIVTQPRRISAISVAERIAAERCENIGQTVGYSIQLESERSPQTQVRAWLGLGGIVTTG